MELNGHECYFFKIGSNTTDLTPLTFEEAQADTFWTVFTVPNPEKYLNLTTPWSNLPEEERNEFELNWNALSLYSADIERDDEKLVAVVEELAEKANTILSNLVVVSIPEDVEWTIQDYDGIEWVAEKHRTWH